MGFNLFHTYYDREYIVEFENGGKNIGFPLKIMSKTRSNYNIPNLTLTET